MVHVFITKTCRFVGADWETPEGTASAETPGEPSVERTPPTPGHSSEGEDIPDGPTLEMQPLSAAHNLAQRHIEVTVEEPPANIFVPYEVACGLPRVETVRKFIKVLTSCPEVATVLRGAANMVTFWDTCF